jgi:hypothetical protein
MAQLPSEGELHVVDNDEADDVFEYCKHAIPHNEMFSRLIRNMYGRLKILEREIADLKSSQKSKVEMSTRCVSP